MFDARKQLSLHQILIGHSFVHDMVIWDFVLDLLQLPLEVQTRLGFLVRMRIGSVRRAIRVLVRVRVLDHGLFVVVIVKRGEMHAFHHRLVLSWVNIILFGSLTVFWLLLTYLLQLLDAFHHLEELALALQLLTFLVSEHLRALLGHEVPYSMKDGVCCRLRHPQVAQGHLLVVG